MAQPGPQSRHRPALEAPGRGQGTCFRPMVSLKVQEGRLQPVLVSSGRVTKCHRLGSSSQGLWSPGSRRRRCQQIRLKRAPLGTAPAHPCPPAARGSAETGLLPPLRPFLESQGVTPAGRNRPAGRGPGPHAAATASATRGRRPWRSREVTGPQCPAQALWTVELGARPEGRLTIEPCSHPQ